MTAPTGYDEFGLLAENAAEWDLALGEAPALARLTAEVAPGQELSGIRWGTEDPELVFLHGGGQNAHTWDTLILALGRPAVAVDLPGHGHSSWRADRDYWPVSNAAAVAAALDAWGVHPAGVIGMSLGGLTTIRLAAIRPDLVPKAVVVDVTPSVHSRAIEMTMEERGSTALIAGPKVYDSFDAMVEATVAMSPNRPVSAVRRGVLHNSREVEGGKWRWRYDIGGRAEPTEGEAPATGSDFLPLWDDVSALTQPLLLVRGGDSKFVLDEHEAELRRRMPGVRVEVVPHAGHAVQSDQPLVLRDLLVEHLTG